MKYVPLDMTSFDDIKASLNVVELLNILTWALQQLWVEILSNYFLMIAVLVSHMTG